MRTAHLIAFSFPPILGVTTERRAGAEAVLLSATPIPPKVDVVTPTGPVKADAHATPPATATSTDVIWTILREAENNRFFLIK